MNSKIFIFIESVFEHFNHHLNFKKLKILKIKGLSDLYYLVYNFLCFRKFIYIFIKLL